MEPKKPLHEKEFVPDVDQRANETFLDQLIDSDGRPMRDAVDLPPDDEDDDDDDNDDR